MRYVFGPSQADYAVKGDITVSIRDIRMADASTLAVDLTIPPHDPAHTAKLSRLFAVAAPNPPASTDTPETYLASGHPSGSTDVADVAAGADVSVLVAGVSPGLVFVQTILGFDE